MIDELVTPEVGTPTRRRKVPWGFVVAGVAIAAAIGYLVIANTSATADYYMTISQLRTCHACDSRAVRVAGIVEQGSVVRDDQTQVIRFSITEGTDVLPITYAGVVPDIFRPGITVVVEGQLGTRGVFQARTLLAKCPSKFQNATPAPAQP
ncbi:MAG TPA: cytochrome c maturation protein CcmE [Ktedonobacterales bacterium]|jgi:cytochrome c-type biogenesis protein CcmE